MDAQAIMWAAENVLYTHIEENELPRWGSGIRLPVQETQVLSLGQEEPLEEETAAHSSIPT